MRAGTKSLTAVLVLLLGFGVASAAVAAVPKGTVGGPPRFPIDPPMPFGSEENGREVVLASTLGRPLGLEIVGFASDRWACIWVSRMRFGGAYGSCGSFAPPVEGPIAISGSGGGSTDAGWVSELDGALAPEVARVAVTYRLGGKEMTRRATVARVQHRLLGVLDLGRPFGYFAIALKGCVTSPIEGSLTTPTGASWARPGWMDARASPRPPAS